MMIREQKAMNSNEYLEFLEKFEAKKTTDSCFTPAPIYDAVLDWVVNEYDLQDFNVLRPFVPDGDYQSIQYAEHDVVIDNPPFSIITQIVRFYEANNIKYFLFANQMTLLSSNAHSSIVTNSTITYTNGAKINTSFLTNLDGAKVRTAPDLRSALKKADELGKVTATLPKYNYPANAVTAASLGKIADVDFFVPHCHATEKLGRLDSQKEKGKTFFGGGILISELKAAELKAAELKAAELKAAELKAAELKAAELKAAELKAAELKAAKEVITWDLSDREIGIISELGKGD